MADYANVFTFTSYQNPTTNIVKGFLKHKITSIKENISKGNSNKNYNWKADGKQMTSQN